MVVYNLLLVIVVWLVSFYSLPLIMRFDKRETNRNTLNPVQKANFGTINAILALMLLKDII